MNLYPLISMNCLQVMAHKHHHRNDAKWMGCFCLSPKKLQVSVILAILLSVFVYLVEIIFLISSIGVRWTCLTSCSEWFYALTSLMSQWLCRLSDKIVFLLWGIHWQECHICPIRALLMDFYLTMKTLHVQYIGCPGK